MRHGPPEELYSGIAHVIAACEKNQEEQMRKALCFGFLAQTKSYLQSKESRTLDPKTRKLAILALEDLDQPNSTGYLGFNFTKKKDCETMFYVDKIIQTDADRNNWICIKLLMNLNHPLNQLWDRQNPGDDIVINGIEALAYAAEKLGHAIHDNRDAVLCRAEFPEE